MMSIAVKKCNSSKTGGEYYRQFRDSKIESFSESLAELDITPILNETDPNNVYNKFLPRLHKQNFRNIFPCKENLLD